MLTGTNEEAVVKATTSPLCGPDATIASTKTGGGPNAGQARRARVLRIEWLGQTAASVFWIGSVLAYGISSSGDWLQLFASSSWLLANVAEAVTIKAD